MADTDITEPTTPSLSSVESMQTNDDSTSLGAASTLLTNDIHRVSVLNYSIHRYSSYSATYIPENILHDAPEDHLSRWSSETSHMPQYLVLKLDRVSIVTHIKFGKYYRNHICNLKRFRIYGGIEDSTPIELLEDGLRNDSKPETLVMKHQIDGHLIPLRYIKIVPIQSWGSFNFSIWHVQLRGINDPGIVDESIKWFAIYREQLAAKHVLKFLRQNNHLDLYEQLRDRCNIQMEDPILTRLNRYLVQEGDFEMAEQLIDEAAQNGLFADYIRKQPFIPEWSHLSSEQYCQKSMPRHSQQLCLDPTTQLIYLLGSSDPESSDETTLSLWQFCIKEKSWKILYSSSKHIFGPSPRHGHRMCIDTIRKKLYLFGRFVPRDQRNSENLKSDFYVFDINLSRWYLISEDTSQDGGPQLLTNHQMCLDAQKNVLYIFGGYYQFKVPQSMCEDLSSYVERFSYSGLWAYDINGKLWQKLRDDDLNASDMRPRTGHVMLLHERRRKLYIIGGQRNREFLRDLIVYHIDSNTVEIQCDGEKSLVPMSRAPLRGSIDPDYDQLHIFVGPHNNPDEINSLWMYDIRESTWHNIYRSEPLNFSSDPTEEIRSKTSHQCVYDVINKLHYFRGSLDSPLDGESMLNEKPTSNKRTKAGLFGKGANDQNVDFWILSLTKITHKSISTICRRLIKRLKFKELANSNPVQAVHYLRNELTRDYDLQDVEEKRQFQSLSLLLFSEIKVPTSESESEILSLTGNNLHKDKNHVDRSNLFDKIVSYFPDAMTQPKQDLTDFLFR
ncbi:Muskelin [Fragariocoptes setiger]|uniref:Muskelin n=1 Tax=Fragariocoptes setiger TaxID=1670756 RepID=A0ABQ7S624_9ACAR|nr:Muskelin [Fragariocoptes setiger]